VSLTFDSMKSGQAAGHNASESEDAEAKPSQSMDCR
jgi:hypothetical protein